MMRERKHRGRIPIFKDRPQRGRMRRNMPPQDPSKVIKEMKRREMFKHKPAVREISKELRKHGVGYLESLHNPVPTPSQAELMRGEEEVKFLKLAMKYIQENGLESSFPKSMAVYNDVLIESPIFSVPEKTQLARKAQVETTKISSRPKPQPAMPEGHNVRATLDNPVGSTPSFKDTTLIPVTPNDNLTSQDENNEDVLAEDIMSSVLTGPQRIFGSLNVMGVENADELTDSLITLRNNTSTIEELIDGVVSLTPLLPEGQQNVLVSELLKVSPNPQPTLDQDNTGSMIPVNPLVDEMSKDAKANPDNFEEVKANVGDKAIGEDVAPDDLSVQNSSLVKASESKENPVVERTDDSFEPTKDLPETKNAYDNAYSLVYGDGFAGDNSALGSAAASEQVVKFVENNVGETALKTIKDGEKFVETARQLAQMGGRKEVIDDMFNEGRAMIEQGKRALQEASERKAQMNPSIEAVKDKVGQMAMDKLQEVATDPSKALDAVQQFGEVVTDPKGTALKAGEMFVDEVKRRAEDLMAGEIPKEASGVLDDMKGLLRNKVDDRKEGGNSQGAGGTGEIVDYTRMLRETRARRMQEVAQQPQQVAQQPRPDQPMMMQPMRTGTPVRNRDPYYNDELRKYTGSVTIKRRPIQRISRRRARNQVPLIQRGVAESKAYKNVFNTSFS